jgi:hypothetical protein
MSNYILAGKEFREVASLEEWAEYMQNEDPYFRHVARTFYYVDDVEYCNLSTVFLAIDHNYGHGAPVLFESMVFGGQYNEEMRRYHDWAEAEIGHYKFSRKIDNLIRYRFEVRDSKNVLGVKHQSVTDVYYYLKIGGYIQFTKNDLRMIRED